MQELNEYREAIEFLAEKQEDFAYDNKGADHAVIVLINMLKNTKNEFLMFSGTFNGDVADKKEFLEELQNYIKSGKIFKLVLEENVNTKSEALQLIEDLEKEKENVQITIAKEKFIEELKRIFDNEVLHFSVSDEKSYRLEVGKNEFKAVCNFNDPKIAKELKRLINLNFNN
jgi:hypothetical protein